MITIAIGLASLLLPPAQDAPPTAQGQPATKAPPALEVHFLANEGFLLRAGEQALLIDAFLEKPYGFYGALSDGTREKLLAGAAPFADIDLALVSHAHGDHLQTGIAARFLEASAETLLASSPQVVDAVAKALGPDSKANARLVPLRPEPTRTREYAHAGIEIELLWLPHGGARWKDMQQLGHVIEIGGFRALHLGDADLDPAHFAPYAKQLTDFDVCFVPYWYFESDAGRSIIAKHLRARLVVAMHVPPVEVEAVREKLTPAYADVVVFGRELDVRRLEPRKPATDDDR
ncbi:MAG: MBL fold metallo-hydrolase [bacterium]|nr:MBL fold metallo-hydrolase [bacterium]